MLQAAGPSAQASLGSADASSIAFFLAIVAVALVITSFAARKAKSSAEYYAVGRPISAAQNGLALAGDYMSAASFLGISGLVALRGFDGMIYATGWLVGWPALMLLVAEPLRNLGKFTLADVVAFRLSQRPVRLAAALGGGATVLFYAMAQMVGAGHLIALVFGVDYVWAEIGVGAVMLLYVLYGGMLATTWVQIIKAVLLLGGVTLLGLLTLSRFGFSPGALYSAVASQYGQAALEPGALAADPLESISLGLALMFGLLGLPHILTRFYTVPDARAARKSVLYATGLIGYFYLIIPIVGFGASALLGRGSIAGRDPGGNLAAPVLADLLGGKPFLGLIAAVGFATILAVVAGLTLAGASAYSHDVYVHVIKRGRATEQQQIRVAKTATVVFGVAAALLGVFFRGQNVAVLVGLAFSIAASANFPALLLSVTWKRLSTAGAVASILTGAVLSVGMIALGPVVWVDILHRPEALVPLRNPCAVSMGAAFAAGILVSLFTPEKGGPALFAQQKVRIHLGSGPG